MPTDSCDLADRTCEPCRGGVPPMTDAEIGGYLKQLGDDWVVNGQGHLEKTFSFPNFLLALDFANALGAEAETAGHHPDLHIAWGKCGVEIWTHKIDGLAEANFILAAKASRIYAPA